MITFLDNFIFFVGTFHEKHKFKYFKNLTVKVGKIWCNDVYMSILQCDISWWKLIDRNWSSGHPSFFAVSTVLHVIISKQDIQICQIFHIYSTTTCSSVLKPKYSLSIRNKCAYLLKSSQTSVTIWRQEYPQNCIMKCFETLADNVFRNNYSMMQI